jgi:hypothetical protein
LFGGIPHHHIDDGEGRIVLKSAARIRHMGKGLDGQFYAVLCTSGRMVQVSSTWRIYAFVGLNRFAQA